jgi:hypothetical protein
MDEFLHWNRDAMSNNETPKEEPKLEAPSIVPAASDEKAVEPVTANAAKSESTVEKIDKLPEAPRLSDFGARDDGEKKPAITLLPALRTAPAADQTKKTYTGPEIVMKPRGSARFGLLAACVAIAASFGAVAGSLSVAKLGPMFAPPAAPAPVVMAPKDNADEVKALRDTVAQLRTTTKSLGDNLAALKTAMNSANTAQNGQIAKLTEALDRVEKGQAEQRRAAAAAPTATAAVTTTTTATARPANADVTGSIAARPQASQASQPSQGQLPAFDAQAALRQSVVQGWVLRRVYDGAALIEGRDGIIEVEPGVVAPGLGRIEGIKRQDGRWVVVTSRGLVIGR